MKNVISEKEEQLQATTVWSFPERGKWATHNAKYRGNWAPQIARNIILLYSAEDDTVLDPMVGSGTTMIEAKLLKRRGIAFDIHPEVVVLAKDGCKFENENCKYEPKISQGDARDLKDIKENTIDFIAPPPPYLNIIS